MGVKKDIISKRYLNDGIRLSDLSDYQKGYLKLFLENREIKYKTVPECPLCKSENSILIAEKDRYAIPLETVVCENCGLIRSYKQLDEKSSEIFYSKYYRNIYEPLGSNLIDKNYQLGARVWGRKERIPKYITKDKIILELGCGGGWNLTTLHNRGYKYYGCDFDKDFIEYGKNKGLNLFVGGLNEVIKRNIKCDYLLLNQVLEHVREPISFLRSLKPILNKNAIVDIHVPSLDLLLWGYANYDLLATLQNAHNFLFNEFTLKTISKIAGFKTINCLAGNLVLQNLQNTDDLILDMPEPNRGNKIVRYLKFVEKTLSLKKKIGAEKILCKKLYCLFNPKGCYKKILMDYLGKVK